MPIHSTYTNARANFAQLLNEVVDNQEVVIISRKGSEDVALISAAELSSLLESAHLLHSPRNAERLMRAVKRARSRTLMPEGVEKLREELGLGEKR